MSTAGIPVRYRSLCPVCGGDLTSEEVAAGRCAATGRELSSAADVAGVDEFVSAFRRVVGPPRALQRLWIRRLLRGESFATVAVTGIGKTTFGAFAALWWASRRRRAYVLLPSSLLVATVTERILAWADQLQLRLRVNDSAGRGLSIAAYHADLAERDKQAAIAAIRSGKPRLVLTTARFLSAHWDDLAGQRFELLFADDVDAILKSSRNTERILTLLGYDDCHRRRRGVLIASTATARVGRGALLLRERLGLDVGSAAYTARNIIDALSPEVPEPERIYSVVATLGDGGLLFCRRIDQAVRLAEALRRWIPVEVADDRGALERFERGELAVLLGVASYYGRLVRGIDLPLRIRWTIFCGAPVWRIAVGELDGASPRVLRMLAILFREHPQLQPFRRALRRPAALRDEQLRSELAKALTKVLESGYQPSASDIVVRPGELVIPDVRTYIQASGRCSRLTPAGLTRGLSVVFEPDPAVRAALQRRAALFDIRFEPLNELDLRQIARELTEDRQRKAAAGAASDERSDPLRPALMIVESPTKARQIARFFGRPAVRVLAPNGNLRAYEVATGEWLLTVVASLGHVADLVTDEGLHGVHVNGTVRPVLAPIRRCRSCGYQSTDAPIQQCPRCGADDIDDAASRIAALRTLASDAERVFLGTDPDAEGERIAWDLDNLVATLAPRRARAEFHEVTRPAVQQALRETRPVAIARVHAQLVRRVEDRWIGFELSKHLWEVFGKHWLSAGRAQTAVLGWIVHRTEEARQRRAVAIDAEWRLEFEQVSEPEVWIEVSELERCQVTLTPPPPYSTDTLLYDAARYLKLNTSQTMQLAQRLFECGLITYHRTDSTHVSAAGWAIARAMLADRCVPRAWGEQGTHEAIRPTRPLRANEVQRLVVEGILQCEGLTRLHYALYDWIVRRFLASQSPPAEGLQARYRICVNDKTIEECRLIEVRGVAAELYRPAFPVLPALPEGRHRRQLSVKKLPRKPLLTEGEAVRLMKERGIGRPSTYAVILGKLKERGYVIERSNRLIATKLGRQIYAYLAGHFERFVSEARTRQLEARMAAVEEGRADPTELLRGVLEELHSIGQRRGG